MRYAVVRDNVVENVVEWDGESDWIAPEGTVLVQSEEASPGNSYDGKTFTPAAPVDPVPEPPTPLVIIANAILADAGTSQALKAAARSALLAGGADEGVMTAPMVAQKG